MMTHLSGKPLNGMRVADARPNGELIGDTRQGLVARVLHSFTVRGLMQLKSMVDFRRTACDEAVDSFMTAA